jgi:hypothetical protein
LPALSLWSLEKTENLLFETKIHIAVISWPVFWDSAFLVVVVVLLLLLLLHHHHLVIVIVVV